MPTSASESILEVRDLSAGYNKINVLRGVTLTVARGERVTLLGPNGAGKTTLLRALSGLLPWTGEVAFDGKDMRGSDAQATSRAGLIHVIEGHRVFTQLSVWDNLLLAGYNVARGERVRRVEEALGLFPELADRRAQRGSALSGGQRQMLAVAQGLVRRPRLLMLDEPSAGLSPVLVDRVLGVIRQLGEGGTAVILVEQLVEKALAATERTYGMAKGKIVLEASSDRPGLSDELQSAYFD